jgi:hypothetical protein
MDIGSIKSTHEFCGAIFINAIIIMRRINAKLTSIAELCNHMPCVSLSPILAGYWYPYPVV